MLSIVVALAVLRRVYGPANWRSLLWGLPGRGKVTDEAHSGTASHGATGVRRRSLLRSGLSARVAVEARLAARRPEAARRRLPRARVGPLRIDRR